MPRMSLVSTYQFGPVSARVQWVGEDRSPHGETVNRWRVTITGPRGFGVNTMTVGGSPDAYERGLDESWEIIEHSFIELVTAAGDPEEFRRMITEGAEAGEAERWNRYVDEKIQDARLMGPALHEGYDAFLREQEGETRPGRAAPEEWRPRRGGAP